MNKVRLRELTERTLAICLALLFVAPLLLTVIRNVPYSSKAGVKLSRWLDSQWIGKPRLYGVTIPAANVQLTLHSLANGEFQRQQARQFNEGFAGREALIHVTNELWFRLFHETGNSALDVVIGKHDVLFFRGYLDEYFLFRNDRSVLEPWVKELRRLQDFCRNIGMGFVVILTPSKVSIYPEDVPDAWRGQYDSRPRGRVVLKELFHDNGIAFVDAVDLVALEKFKRPPVPLFPKGAAHWNSRAALVAANAIQARLAEQGKAVWPIEVAERTISEKPEAEEGDLLRLLNLIFPWRYPCERLTIKRRVTPPSAQLTMAAIGSSFTWELSRQLSTSGQFSDISVYFHYRLYKSREMGDHSETVRKPATPVDFSREIFAADCLLLELNESITPSPEHYLSAFIKDALAHLPDPAAPRLPFRPD